MVSPDGPGPVTPIDAVVERAPIKGRRAVPSAWSSVVIGVASTAPAYSLAATLGLVVAAVGLQSPIIVLLAFIPAFLVAQGYKELNKADPDCGTTFTWATRAFGPRTGWMGGWGIVAADVIVMANLAADRRPVRLPAVRRRRHRAEHRSGSTVAGVVLIVADDLDLLHRHRALGARCRRRCSASRSHARRHLGHRAGPGLRRARRPRPSSPSSRGRGSTPSRSPRRRSPTRILAGLFIYWGWDTAVSVNEETKDRATPRVGRRSSPPCSCSRSTCWSPSSAQAFAGVGDKGIGLGNPDNSGDVLSVLGNASLRHRQLGAGSAPSLLILMVLTSAAASTQTTILPTARTTLSMAVFKAIPAKLRADAPAVPDPDGGRRSGMGLRLDRVLRDADVGQRRT